MDSGRLFFDGSGHGNLLLLGNNRDTLFRGPRSLLNMEESSKRRPFFCSSEELMMDEEFYDEQLPEKKRRLTSEQVQLLEKSFEAENKLEPERKTQLAKKLGLQPRQVAVWFQNRRARWKTKQLERDYDLLKASYDSLLSDYQALSNHNDDLKSQVLSLTEKLQSKEMGLQLVDSGDSYFHEDYGPCMDAVDCAQSEEDDVSDDARSYFSDVFAAVGHGQQHEETDHLGLWDCS